MAKPLPDGHLILAGSFIAPDHATAWHNMAWHGISPIGSALSVCARVRIEGITAPSGFVQWEGLLSSSSIVSLPDVYEVGHCLSHHLSARKRNVPDSSK